MLNILVLAIISLKIFLASQNCEVCVPGILGFLLFKIDNRIEDVKLYGGSHTKSAVAKTLMAYIEKIESILISAIKEILALKPLLHMNIQRP